VRTHWDPTINGSLKAEIKPEDDGMKISEIMALWGKK